MTTYSKWYRRYILLILTGVYIFNFIDRQLLVILQEPIKAELKLSDSQLGLLTGFAFAIFYVTLGLPIARWADRSNRKNIVAFSLAFWSAMTAVSGLVGNFVQLLLARIGVGIGEAGGSPPSHAIISDYFPPEKRATALSIFSTGIYIGVLFGFLIGGVVGQYYGWRTAFYALGIPGLAFAVLVYFTVREPIKGSLDISTGEKAANPALKEVVQTLFNRKTFVFIAFASGMHTFGTYGIGNWLPPFLARLHGLDTATIGIWLALTTGFGGVLGTFLGGYLADRLGKADVKWYLWIPTIALAINLIPSALIFFSSNTILVLISSFFFNLLLATYLGPVVAVTHSLVSANRRAFASAVLFFILNLIGLGFGPLTLGMVSDWLTPSLGVEGLRWAFTITFLTSALSILLFYLGAKRYPFDLKVVN